jgi:hypothetical protein
MARPVSIRAPLAPRRSGRALGGSFDMTYQQLATAVSDAGFFTTGDLETKVICASKVRPEGGYTGNSFWVAQRQSRWFLGTWGPHIYRIAEASRVADLCITWLRRHPDGTAYDIDAQTREELHLVEVDPDDLPDA